MARLPGSVFIGEHVVLANGFDAGIRIVLSVRR